MPWSCALCLCPAQQFVLSSRSCYVLLFIHQHFHRPIFSLALVIICHNIKLLPTLCICITCTSGKISEYILRVFEDLEFVCGWITVLSFGRMFDEYVHFCFSQLLKYSYIYIYISNTCAELHWVPCICWYLSCSMKYGNLITDAFKNAHQSCCSC